MHCCCGCCRNSQAYPVNATCGDVAGTDGAAPEAFDRCVMPWEYSSRANQDYIKVYKLSAANMSIAGMNEVAARDVCCQYQEHVS